MISHPFRQLLEIIVLYSVNEAFPTVRYNCYITTAPLIHLYRRGLLFVRYACLSFVEAGSEAFARAKA